MEPVYVYSITKQYDVSESSKGWAELETADGTPFVYAYPTKEAAETALRRMVPDGVDPWIYGGYRVERCANRGLFCVM